MRKGSSNHQSQNVGNEVQAVFWLLLAQYLLADYGSDLTSHELTDAALLMLEGSADCELPNEAAMNLIIKQIREQYDDLINEGN